MQRAITQQNLGWFHRHLPALLLALQQSPPVGGAAHRLAEKLRDVARVLRRAFFPTGMSVLVEGGRSPEQRSEFAEDIRRSLTPAFRRTSKATLADLLIHSAELWTARVRSTLITSTADGHPLPFGWRKAANRLLNFLARQLIKPDVEFLLPSDRLKPLAAHPHQSATALNAAASPEQQVHDASWIALQWMAARLQRRQPASRANSRTPPLSQPERQAAEGD
jgi:hypothetical protein